MTSETACGACMQTRGAASCSSATAPSARPHLGCVGKHVLPDARGAAHHEAQRQACTGYSPGEGSNASRQAGRRAKHRAAQAGTGAATPTHAAAAHQGHPSAAPTWEDVGRVERPQAAHFSAGQHHLAAREPVSKEGAALQCTAGAGVERGARQGGERSPQSCKLGAAALRQRSSAWHASRRGSKQRSTAGAPASTRARRPPTPRPPPARRWGTRGRGAG